MIKYIYQFLKIFNDIKSVKTGRIGKRIGWRVSGKMSGKLFGKWFK